MWLTSPFWDGNGKNQINCVFRYLGRERVLPKNFLTIWDGNGNYKKLTCYSGRQQETQKTCCLGPGIQGVPVGKYMGTGIPAHACPILEWIYLVIQVRSSGMTDILELAGTFLTQDSKQNSLEKPFLIHIGAERKKYIYHGFEISPTLTDSCQMWTIYYLWRPGFHCKRHQKHLETRQMLSVSPHPLHKGEGSRLIVIYKKKQYKRALI